MDKRIEEIMSILIKIASGDFDFKYQSSKKQDKIDAIGIGLEMVSDELNKTMISKKEHQKNEKKYRAIFENSGTIILNLDPKTTKVIDYNEYSQKFYGFTKEEMDNLYISSIAITDKPGQKRVVDVEDEKSYKFETKHRTKYGDKTLNVNAKTYEVDGKIFLNVIMNDITDQKLNEEKLIANEQKYRSLFENSLSIVLVANPKTSKLISYNKFAKEFYGYDEAKMNSLYLKDVNDDKNRGKLRKKLSSLKEEETFEFETKQLTKYGFRDVSVNVRCFLEKEELLIHIIMNDVTYKKENEQILVNARKSKALAMIDAEENERKRIAQELHDGIGQNLTAVKLMLAAIKKNECLEKKETELLLEAKRTIEDTMSDIRKISQNLVPSVLNDFGLASALEKMIGRIKSVSDIRVTVVIDPSIPPINRDKELILYRIAQESVNNAVKHSSCKGLIIQLVGYPDKICLTIKDDGVGFIKKNAFLKGIGLYNIEERCKMLNGKLIINTKENEGTEIIVEI